MTNADWANKDFYKTAGRRQGRVRRRHQEGLPLPRPGQPPGLPPGQRRCRGALQGGGRGLRRRGRPRQAQAVRRAPRPGGWLRPVPSRGRWGVDVRLQRRLRSGRDPGPRVAAASPTCWAGCSAGAVAAHAPAPRRSRAGAPTSRPRRRSASPTRSTASRSPCG